MKKLLLLLLPLSVFGQKFFVNSIPVTKGGDTLRNAWTGGMNAPIFSSIDWNGDGIQDLVAYDKFGWRPIPFLNNGSGTSMPYTFAPEYTRFMPPLRDWMLFRDFNGDGVADIFSLETNNSIGCYKGQRLGKQWSFTKYKPQLRYTDGSFFDRIWTFFNDMPAVVDVDRDGDLDLLVFSISGGTNIEYYQNQSVETGYGRDSFNFMIADYCWGGFAENSLNNNVTLNFCKRDHLGEPVPNNGRHEGGTLYTFDYENDHDVDVVIGDISYNNLLYMRNDGDSSHAHMVYYDSIFPRYDTSVNLPIFPGAYDVDGDNDGRRDLFIAPFWGGPDLGQIQDTKNVLFYKNEGLPENKFHYVSNDYITASQMDFGTDSKPVFFDYNGDGLLDIVVGNYGYYNPFNQSISELGLLQNNGNDTAPSYFERGLDWSNISAFQWVNVHPAFGDLNGDGYSDMIIGESTGAVHYFKNAGTTTATFPAVTTLNFGNIDVGEMAAPFIYDLNGDSLNDLIIGDKLGRVHYFRNFGTRTTPRFNNDTANHFLGNIRTNDPSNGYNNGNAAPVVTVENGQTMIYCGSLRGFIYKFIVDPDSLNGGAFQRLDSNFLKERVGFRSVLSIADLNHDGKADYLTGNSRGGLMLYSDSAWEGHQDTVVNAVPELEKSYGLKVYPNPAKGLLQFDLTGEDMELQQVELIDLLGASVLKQSLNGHHNSVSLSNVSEGLYVVRISANDGKLFTRRISVVR
ncbi:MAG: T9SS type A sorting domain-containing protein [Chitinophagales bacterium]